MAGNVSGLQAQRATLVAKLEAAQKSGDTAAIKEARVALFDFDGANPTPAETTVEKSDDKPLTPEQQAKKEEAHSKALQEIAEAKALATAEATETAEAKATALATATAEATETAEAKATAQAFLDGFGRTRDTKIAGQYAEATAEATETAEAKATAQAFLDGFGRTRDTKIAGQYAEATAEAWAEDIVTEYVDGFDRTHD